MQCIKGNNVLVFLFGQMALLCQNWSFSYICCMTIFSCMWERRGDEDVWLVQGVYMEETNSKFVSANCRKW